MKFDKYVFLLIGIGIIIFFPVLLNGFAADDYKLIVKNSFISPSNIPLFFVKSFESPHKTGLLLDFYYRPMPLVFFSIFYTTTQNAFLLHLFQVSLYIINTILVFFLFRNIFKDKFAFFLTLIFLVHPINQSIAAYISALQENLFFFFGILAILILINKRAKTTRHVIVSNLLLLLSMLSKETGILFVFISLLYISFFQRKSLKTYLLVTVIMLCLYTLLRIAASEQYFMRLIDSDILKTSWQDRLAVIPQTISFYLKVIFSPNISIPTLSKLHHMSYWENIMSWLTIFVFLIITAISGFYVWIVKKQLIPHYIFFFVWFLLGIVFHMQLFALDTIAEKRWLYFSSVGFLGIIGITVSNFTIKNKKIKIICLILITAIIGLYTLITIRLNLLWGEWYK